MQLEEFRKTENKLILSLDSKCYDRNRECLIARQATCHSQKI
ncbi:hypothetical protein CJA_1877 [Cellvibrio japonicus Ueda107]|uniref:Uncharacterized protein n=1 Tax=Cellvibrio japonicus (strain Ueda107) TaxID=498211 RepID=B3PGM6_CELJU|nr:hypothetical protein CJA_1877 [Cellvibrio japonicus Ueda107]